MKTRNKKQIIVILVLIVLLIAMFSGMTAYAEEVEPSPTPPLTEDDIGGIFAGLWNSVKDFLFTILGNVTLFVLWLVDCMFALIGVLSGSGVVSGEQGILEALLAEEGIKNALFGITALGSVLVFFVGAFAVFRRSTSERQGAVGTVVKNMLKAVALFIAVPMLCLALIFIVNMLIQGINLAISGGTVSQSFGSMLFETGAALPKNFFEDSKFFQTQMPITMYNVDALKTVCGKYGGIDIQSVDWLIVLAGGIALLWFCFPMIIMLVSRLFELVILYLFDAIPISFMPYDDGERFNHWKDEFVEKFMSAYGVVLSYSLFGMLMPTMMNMSFIGGNSFFKIIVILGGAYFMNKAPQLINGILGLKGSGIGDVLGGIGLRQSMGAGIKGTGAIALGAGALAFGKAKSIGGSLKNKIAPSGSVRAEKVLNKQEKLEARGQWLEEKRGRQGNGSGDFSNVKPRGSFGKATSYNAKQNSSTATVANKRSSSSGGNDARLSPSNGQKTLSPKVGQEKMKRESAVGQAKARANVQQANHGYIPLSPVAVQRNNVSRNASVKSPTRNEGGQNGTRVSKKINRNANAVPPTRNSQTQLDSKIQRNNAKLAKNTARVGNIRKEVEKNALISGADYRRNWEKARKRRDGK